ncbi:MAG: hypothetical protein ACJAYF_002196 [Arenicella sp.]|jgi:hypothetical protein
MKFDFLLIDRFSFLYRLPLAVAGLHFFDAKKQKQRNIPQMGSASQIPEFESKFSGAAELASLRQSSRLPRKI